MFAAVCAPAGLAQQADMGAANSSPSWSTISASAPEARRRRRPVIWRSHSTPSGDCSTVTLLCFGLTRRSRYQRRGEYRLAPSRFSFQTSPHLRQRQYDAAVTVLLVVVSSVDRHAGHTLGGGTFFWLARSTTHCPTITDGERETRAHLVFFGCSTSYRTRAMLSFALARAASVTTMTMPTARQIVTAMANEENIETSGSCAGRAAEGFSEPGCPQDGRRNQES